MNGGVRDRNDETRERSRFSGKELVWGTWNLRGSLLRVEIALDLRI